jgi:hypothetical protein
MQEAENKSKEETAMNVKAYLQVIMTIDPENRAAAAKVYTDYRQPFLDTIRGAMTKELLIRDEDVQVIHGFDSMEHAKAYLDSELFKTKVFPGLQPTWAKDPDIRFYSVA